ncbi:MAG: C39 family peptidase [Candidatus Methanosuratincola sp.]|jgi:hypothetical protein|nr:C39 family peptidase [Candidatus Methanosuratincola sp.]
MSNEIPRDELFEHVKISATVDTVSRMPGAEGWLKAKVSRLPVKIFDINGELLFCDYPVQSAAKGGGTLGHVRASPRKDIAPPIVSYELGPRRWNLRAAVEKLTPSFKEKFPRLSVTDVKLVCYSYPKLGVMFQAVDPTGATSRHIFDVASLSQVPERKERLALEGFFAWSYIESLTDEIKSARLRQYEQLRGSLNEIPEGERLAMLKAETIQQYAKSGYVDTILKLVKTKLLQYCTHYDYKEARSHHCFVLQGQQLDDYCAVATCQMVLCYYRYYYTQDQIAPKLNYSSGSGCPPDQSSGYEQLTCDHLDATYDSSPTFSEAKAQIDALHPFKSGITGHARACAGYQSNMVTKADRLYIYDPWPWDADYKLAGSIAWEDWSSVTHTNYVFTKLACP